MTPRLLRLRPAFTLFGLLVVLFLLALLLALLLPAIQKVREVANRTRCANNLKQIAIATHNYHNVYNRLPPGYYGDVPAGEKLTNSGRGNDPQFVGCLLVLLPYLEQDNLFKQCDVRNLSLTGGDVKWWTVPANVNNAKMKLQLFQCPSDTLQERTSQGVMLYVTVQENKIDGLLRNEDRDQELGRTNYTGCAGALGTRCTGKAPNPFTENPAPEWKTYEGIFGNRTGTTLVTVMDGTSNTLMFGEGLGGQGIGARDRAWSWMGVGCLGTLYGLGRSTNRADLLGASWNNFSSRHSQMVNFSFGDGSVRGIRFGNTAYSGQGEATTDWALLQQLAGRADGYNQNASAIVD